MEGADWGAAPGRCASGVRAKGWDALSLAAKELTRLFPLLWETLGSESASQRTQHQISR